MRAYHLATTSPKPPKPLIKTRRRNLRPFVVFGAVVLALLVLGGAHEGAVSPASNLDSAATRSQTISQALSEHKVDAIIGDYWRILPTNQQKAAAPTPVPLHDCFTSSSHQLGGKTSSGYQQTSFAYLVSSDLAQDALLHCSRQAVVRKFGQPSAITIIAGSAEQPKEELLFYDTGAQKPQKHVTGSRDDEFHAASGNGRTPIDVKKLANQSCPGHHTILQIVAHEDDDLLFMSPDLLHTIQQGDCVRTVYMTAGDAGSSKFYWLSRERGSEAAYSLLSAAPDDWAPQTVKLGPGRFVVADSPVGSSQLTLVFMHLPDGKPDGQGFGNSDFESLAKLASGEKTSIRSVDGQSTYTYDELVNALRTLMELYKPDEVRTLRPANYDGALGDHSDHLKVGQLTAEAYKGYQVKHSAAKLGYYMGYPVRAQPVNVDGDELLAKEQAFFTYANFDGAVCSSIDNCLSRGDYGDYLQRQYRSEP